MSSEPEIIILKARGREFLYVLTEIPCDIAPRGFLMRRLRGGETYQITIGEPRECTCTCMAFIRWRLCKHITAILMKIGREGIDN